jgi:hypothetical protein
MNTIKNMLMTVIAITFLSTSAFAGSVGFGVTGSIAVVEANGTETDGTSTGASATDVSSRAAAASNNVAIGSVFAEYMFDGDHGMTFGIDWIPGAADVNSKKLSRTDATADAGETDQDDGTYTAQAEVENHMTYYAELPIHGGLYVKAGYVEMDVNTTETSIGGTYGNTSVDGTLLGLGYKVDFGTSSYYKLEGTQTEFDTITLKSTTNNQVKADLDVTRLTFALGYKF